MSNPAVLSVPAFDRLADFVGVWAMEPQAARALWAMVCRTDLTTHMAAGPPPRRPEATAGRPGSVAVVPILGTMAKARSSFGGTSTVEVRRDIRQAATNPNVSAILLAIDSPGGTVAGTADLAAEVKAAAKQKPVWAHIDDLGASAAYWVASQADQVFANAPTALVGNIGSLLVVQDTSKAAEAAGIRTLVFATGPLKAAGADGTPVTEDQAAYLQGLVNASQAAFDAAVVSGRRLNPQQLATVRTGAIYPAGDAVRLKLIDGIRPLNQTIDALAAAAGRVRTVTAAVPSNFQMNETTNGTHDTTAILADPTPSAQHADTQATTPDPVAAERQRVAAIAEATEGHPLIRTQAINEGWDGRRAQLAVLRASRPPVGAARGSGVGPEIGANYLAAAIMIRAGMESAAERSFGAEVMNRVGRLRSMSLVDMCAYALHLDGRDVPANRSDMIRAASSGGSMPTALGDAAHKVLEVSYGTVPASWRSWCAVRPAANFKTHYSVRPTFSGELEQLPPDGQIKHGTFGEETFSWSVDTFAKMYSIDRRTIVNDDLNAFSEIIPSFGKAAARALANLIYKGLLANAGSFFSAGHNNLLTGGGSALALAGLSGAVKAMRTQRDAEGNDLDLRPAVAVVPPELETTARQLLSSLLLSRDATQDQVPTGNPFVNAVSLEVESRLSNPNFTGHSATGWYLFGTPADVPAVVGFLDGVESPRIEMFGFDSDLNTLAMKWRVYHDFGFALGDFRPAVKNAGA